MFSSTLRVEFGAPQPLTVRLRNLLLRVEIGAAAEEQERTVEGA